MQTNFGKIKGGSLTFFINLLLPIFFSTIFLKIIFFNSSCVIGFVRMTEIRATEEARININVQFDFRYIQRDIQRYSSN